MLNIDGKTTWMEKMIIIDGKTSGWKKCSLYGKNNGWEELYF